MIGLVADHYMDHGELMDFMGKPARTALSPPKLR
jgi:Kdo2-lipid IVA lauroyltransferase/acyltransferase